MYTTDEVAQLRTSSILLGAIWWGLSYAPIMTWYLWRRPGIRAEMDVNPWYHRAWNVMWMSHYFVFQLPAIIAPLTYFGSQSINDMYIFINYWVGTMMGGVVAAYTTLMFNIALATFTEVDGLKKQHVVAEIASYIFLTFGLWNIAHKELVPNAYEWLQLAKPKSERNFRGSE